MILKHDIKKGAICEIAVLAFGQNSKLFGGRLTHTRYGKFGREEGEYIGFYDAGGYFRIKQDNIRSLRTVTPEEAAKQRYVGQKVLIHKYGSFYGGKVVKVGRTRVTVSFVTNGGKEKTATASAWETRTNGLL
jgi:hypothetical protein